MGQRQNNWKVILFLCAAFLGYSSLSLATCRVSKSLERIIYVGDSHSVQLFGRTLDGDLKASGLPGSQFVERYAVAGSAANHWNNRALMHQLNNAHFCEGGGNSKRRFVPAGFPLFNELMAGPPPKAVVIALGTNDVGWNCKLEGDAQTASVRKLLAQIPAPTACVWVGPIRYTVGPLKRKCGQSRIDSFVDNLETEVRKRCTYLDSRVLRAPQNLETLTTKPQTRAECTQGTGQPLFPNAGDGLHLMDALATYWADCVSLGIIEALTADPKFSRAPSLTSALQVKN